MANFVVVCKAEEVEAGEGRVVEVGGTRVALFNVEGTFYAIDNTCLHRQGPLGEGELEGKIVTCPWHGWQYDVTTGKHTGNPSIGVAKYECKVENGEVKVKVG
ncbi:MAG: Rieske (2Fe-2S) protein [Nitrospinota bacterium]